MRTATISKRAVATYGTLFAIGGAWEVPMVLRHHRHPVLATYRDVNAIPAHLVVLGLVVAALLIGWWRARPWLGEQLCSPLTGPSFRAFVLAPARPVHAAIALWREPGAAAAGRLLVSPLVVLAWFMMIWAVVRSGEELVMNIDPATRVNAWGGPSWAGAVGAHWLDALIAFLVCAWIVVRFAHGSRSR